MITNHSHVCEQCTWRPHFSTEGMRGWSPHPYQTHPYVQPNHQALYRLNRSFYPQPISQTAAWLTGPIWWQQSVFGRHQWQATIKYMCCVSLLKCLIKSNGQTTEAHTHHHTVLTHASTTQYRLHTFTNHTPPQHSRATSGTCLQMSLCFGFLWWTSPNTRGQKAKANFHPDTSHTWHVGAHNQHNSITYHTFE